MLIKFLMLLCAAGTTFISGCASARVVTNLEPESDPDLQSPAGLFYIAMVKLKFDNGNPQTVENNKKYQQKTLPLLRKECMTRYPKLFAENAAGSIPLEVEVETTKFKVAPVKVTGWLYTYDSEEDFCVRVSAWTGQENVQGEVLQKNVHREEHARKNIELKIDVQAMEDSALQQRVSQIATAIAKLVVTQDSTFWTAQSRGTTFTALSPAPNSNMPKLTPAPTTLDPF